MINVSNRHLILGTGNFGAIVFDVLAFNGVQVAGFLDLNPRNQGRSFLGLEIRGIESIQGGDLIYLASNRNNHDYLRDRCLALNNDVAFPSLGNLLVSYRAQFSSPTWDYERCVAEVENYLTLNELSDHYYRSLDVVLTEKCTLKCKDCSNLMQYYESAKNASVDQIISSLELLEASGLKFKEIRLIGGEPLIHKGMDRLLEYLETSSLGRKCVLFTNGTIVPRPSTLSLLKRCGVRVQISKYSGNLSMNWDRLVSALANAEVQYTLEEVLSWNDCGQIVRVNATPEAVAETFSNCCVNDAMTLLHDRLYGCPFSAHFHNLNDSPESFSGDWIQLSATPQVRIIEALRSLRHVNYYSACFSCKGRDYKSVTIPAAVQTVVPLTFQRRV